MNRHCENPAISGVARRIAKRMASAILALTLAVAAFSASTVMAEEEVWMALLRDQLDSELNCKLNYTTNVRKFELAGQQMVDARAHCYDKRMFDVSWRPEAQKFDIRTCEPVTC